MLNIEAMTELIFQVMIQRHNRDMSISLYISCLAITDTIALLLGKCACFNTVHFEGNTLTELGHYGAKLAFGLI